MRPCRLRGNKGRIFEGCHLIQGWFVAVGFLMAKWDKLNDLGVLGRVYHEMIVKDESNQTGF